MTAKISPTINSGTTIPVDALALKARAIKVTLTMAIPFMPAFESPITNAAVKARAHAVIEMSNVVPKNKNEV